jgi:hypothetical protein
MQVFRGELSSRRINLIKIIFKNRTTNAILFLNELIPYF